MNKVKWICMGVKLVPTDKVVSNDYNPNKVASPEMKLLEKSILEDGLTMPIVTFYDQTVDKYIVVDGFHRYTILKKLKCTEIPITTIDKPIEDRMASTIRHNRARGVHKVDIMSDIVLKLIQLGWKDKDVAKHLGMEFEEILRLKQITGVAALFENRSYSKSWVINNS
jgi:ParB-like chromosome segregation protein Spo0J